MRVAPRFENCTNTIRGLVAPEHLSQAPVYAKTANLKNACDQFNAEGLAEYCAAKSRVYNEQRLAHGPVQRSESTLAGERLMKIFRAAALLALLTGPAYGQMPSVNWIPEAKSRTPEEIEQDNVKDKAYRDSTRKIPDGKVASDPWGIVRGPDKKAASQPKPRAKSGAAMGQ